MIPHCAPKDKHLEGDLSMCTYDAFMECVDLIVPKDYEMECQVKSEHT